MKNIVVNATALNSGGGLSILKQFLDNIDSLNSYHIFVNEDLNFKEISNVTFYYIKKQSGLQRFFWDALKLYLFLFMKKIKCDLLISLQNTSIFAVKTPQIIYLHNGLFLSDKSWSFFSNVERKYAFYKYVYPLFIFIFCRENTEFVVQTQWMKDNLISKYKLNARNIHVIKPDIIRVNINEINQLSFRDKKSFFYPSTNELFKNHVVLIEALNELKLSGEDISNYVFYFTCEKENSEHLVKLIGQYDLELNVCFIGHKNYEEVLMYYKSCDVVVFPSLIESFGLPLLEAGMFGKPLLCNKLLFTEEVIGDYSGAVLLNNSSKDWADAILHSQKDTSFEPFNPHFKYGWKSFFNLINQV